MALSMALVSYQMISPTLASILKSQEIIFAFILQSFLEQTVPSCLTIVGASFVMISAMVTPLEYTFIATLPRVVQPYF